MEGVSLAYTFTDGQAKSRHVTQYFEIAGTPGSRRSGSGDRQHGVKQKEASCRFGSTIGR